MHITKNSTYLQDGNNSTTQATSAHETRTPFFSWHTIATLYNKLPAGITTCSSPIEAKYYTSVLLFGVTPLFPFFLLPALYCFMSARKEASHD